MNKNKAVILLFFIAFLFLCGCGDKINKEVTKEEKVTEKQQTENAETKENTEAIIRNKVNNLISETNSKSNSIKRYYANEVNYYKGGKMSIDKIMKDKINFFNKWDNIEMSIENINISKESETIYFCTFDKYFKSENYNSQKSYNGKVRSKLVFQKINNEWLVVEEKDEKVYYTDKKEEEKKEQEKYTLSFEDENKAYKRCNGSNDYKLGHIAGELAKDYEEYSSESSIINSARSLGLDAECYLLGYKRGYAGVK